MTHPITEPTALADWFRDECIIHADPGTVIPAPITPGETAIVLHADEIALIIEGLRLLNLKQVGLVAVL